MNPLPDGDWADFPPPCKAGNRPYVRAPMAVGKYGTNPGPCAGNWPTTVNIMDTVRVPATLPPGEYVLGWRWDCELTVRPPAILRTPRHAFHTSACLPHAHRLVWQAQV
jgi:hypothetical protein